MPRTRRSSPKFIPILLLGVLALVVPAQAYHGDPNDANSGGDAGNHALLALPLNPGTYQGTITRGQTSADPADYYSFQASAGQRVFLRLKAQAVMELRLRLPHDGPSAVVEPDGRGFGSILAGAGTIGGFPVPEESNDSYLIPFDGRYLMKVEFFPFAEGGPGRFHYEFEFALETPEDGVRSSSTGRWQVLEVRWSEPAVIRGVIHRVGPGEGHSDPYSSMVRIEYCSGCSPDGGWSSHTGRNGEGRTIAVNPAPDAEAPFPIDAGVRRGWESLFIRAEAPQGFLRAMVYRTDQAQDTFIGLASTVPFERASAEGNDLVVWNETSAGTPDRLLAPGVSSVGPRDFALDVQGEFAGFFDPRPFEGSATDPDGNPVALPNGIAWLTHPAAGTWNFHLGATQGVGPGVGQGAVTVPGANKNYLDGVFLPDLGLFG